MLSMLRSVLCLDSTTRTRPMTHSDGYLHDQQAEECRAVPDFISSDTVWPFLLDQAPVTAHSPTQQAQMNVLTVE
jgi:hypothetical protein